MSEIEKLIASSLITLNFWRNNKNMKRKNECFVCGKRKCFERVVSTDCGKTYDEIACPEHISELHHNSDIAIPRIMKYFISSSSCQKRGEGI